jgi:hypothetical protein
MATKKFSLVRGFAMRATRLDGCGRPVLGPDSVIASDGFITVGLTANIEEGEEISQTNAAGKLCITDKPQPRFTGYTAAITFCGVDPELISMLTGNPVVLSADGLDVVGFDIESDTDLAGTGFALELWSKVPIAACDATGGESYGYMVIPFLQGGTLGDVTVENAAVNFALAGADSKDGNEWGVGPYDVVRDETGIAGPLNNALKTTNHFHLELTSVPPPDVDTTGATSLGVPATGATAGTPATLTPANSYAPADFTDMPGLTATPTTAWTAGQYVLLRDGSTAHWDASAWASGPAPA